MWMCGKAVRSELEVQMRGKAVRSELEVQMRGKMMRPEPEEVNARKNDAGNGESDVF